MYCMVMLLCPLLSSHIQRRLENCARKNSQVFSFWTSSNLHVVHVSYLLSALLCTECRLIYCTVHLCTPHTHGLTCITRVVLDVFNINTLVLCVCTVSSTCLLTHKVCRVSTVRTVTYLYGGVGCARWLKTCFCNIIILCTTGSELCVHRHSSLIQGACKLDNIMLCIFINV